MNSEQIKSLIRTLLTAAGTYTVAKGWLSSELANEAVGAVLTLTSVVWSFKKHATPNDKAPTS